MSISFEEACEIINKCQKLQGDGETPWPEILEMIAPLIHPKCKFLKPYECTDPKSGKPILENFSPYFEGVELGSEVDSPKIADEMRETIIAMIRYYPQKAMIEKRRIISTVNQA